MDINLENNATLPYALLPNIPIELQHCIFLLLDPLDVVSVGSTCKALRDSSNDRTLWAQILHQTSLKNRFLLYDDGQSVPIRHLKHAATRPARMLRRLQHHKTPVASQESQSITEGLTPVQTRMISPNSEHRIRRQSSCLFLIPGGRFLVSSIGDSLSVWDLDSSSPTIIASATCRAGFVFLVTPSRDQRSFRISVSSNRFSTTGLPLRCKLTIYTFSPDNPGHLECVETELEAQRDYDLSVFTLVDDVFVYLHRGNVHAWNFINNKFSSWSLPPAYVDQQYPEIFIHETKQLVIIGERYVLAWDIPAFVGLKEYHSKTAAGHTYHGPMQPTSTTPIDLSLMFSQLGVTPEPPTILPVFCETTHDWYNSFSSPTSFDIIWTSTDDPHDYFTTIDLKNRNHKKDCSAGLGPTFKLLKLGTATDDSRCLDSWRLCDDSLVKGCYRGDQYAFEVIVAPQDNQSEESEEHKIFFARLGVFNTGLRRADDFDRFWFSFDPGSGRVCYLSEIEQKIVVVDYVGM
ncbi:hypothetical protein CVT24_001081 [Panaeolus cyanescens]|uniref:F-box domain-containing protein n=1 Tax=Panaeolus cyanescens TaxID=181874 RepID=A0A409VX54_9AGAR|nr:hypothetical protein CVT24_001081 [Panaeolus cyanescens]